MYPRLRNCHADCSSRARHEPPHAKSHIKKVIGVVSGKGGVGKSMTSAMMAVSMRRKGYKVGVLDADITGPSIPKLFGVHGPAMGTEDGINPVESHTGIKIMSINLLEDEEAPVVWRGPVIAGAVKQFWQEVIWDDVDFLFVDTPPGNRRCAADRVPDPAGRRHHYCIQSAGAGRHDRWQGCADGRNDEGSHPWHCGKHTAMCSARTAASISTCLATAMWTRPARSTPARAGQNAAEPRICRKRRTP